MRKFIVAVLEITMIFYFEIIGILWDIIYHTKYNTGVIPHMKKAIKLFCSVYVTLILLAIYGILCAIATFIEADAAYGTQAAQDLIYRTALFNIVHFLLLLNLIGVFIDRKVWKSKKYYSIILHVSFIVILLGAAITRFFGFEGMVHIREGGSSNSIITLEEYVNIHAEIDGEVYFYNIPVRYNPVTQTHFNESITLKGKPLTVKFDGYHKGHGDNIDTITLTTSYNNVNKQITIPRSYLDAQLGQMVELGDAKFSFVWGPSQLIMPFKIYLEDFIVTRYPGSKSPSSYKSIIKVENSEDNTQFDYEIFMNNVLDYKGYRFFQSSYDPDEQGTILSVNKDPGKLPTYLGYFLLTVGFVWSFFGKYSRIWQLGKYLKKQNLYIFIAAISSVLLMTANHAYAQEGDAHANHTAVVSQQEIDALIESIKTKMGPHSKEAAKILVQDTQGRIKPLDTLALDILHKLIRKEEYKGMNHMEVFLGMMMYSDYFKSMKMFPVKSKELRMLLGIPLDEEFASFNDIFDATGKYKLIDAVNRANQVSPYNRNKFEKELLKFNERMGIAYYVYDSNMFMIIPDITGNSTGFVTPGVAISTFDTDNATQVKNIMQSYFSGINSALADNNWAQADKALADIKEYQKTHGHYLVPSNGKIFVEILMNNYNPFKNLTFVYVLLGIILFGFVLTAILKNKPVNKIAGRILFILSIIAVVLHTLGLISRWYIAGYAPWSNAYESMIYIAWAGAAAGLIFFRKSLLSVSATNFVAGITLFVANLGFMDPQIGTLVPVLKSYWLNIHVSVITASYSFFGLSLVLGVVALVLFILRSDKRKHIDQSILNINAINEISLILGLGLLTIGTFLGGVWANESWGRYWGWDPKETWSLITIVAYTVVLHVRLIKRFNTPYIFSVASTLGFYAVLMTYFGVNFYLSGKHSYASGEPVPIPTFLYFMVAIHIILIVLSYFKRNLNTPELESKKEENK